MKTSVVAPGWSSREQVRFLKVVLKEACGAASVLVVAGPGCYIPIVFCSIEECRDGRH